MGLCSGKCSCSHFAYPDSHEPHLLTCCGQKVLHRLRDQGDETAKLLVYDQALMLSDDKKFISRDAKSEEEVFGYNLISQEDSRSRSRQGTPKNGDTPKRGDRNLGTVAAEDVIMPTFLPTPNFDTREKVDGKEFAFFPLPPNKTELSMYIVTWNMNGKVTPAVLETHHTSHQIC
jgi:hypothetical protein